MAIVVKEVIYLGTFVDADTNEATAEIENTSVYQQTFGSVGAPLNDAREDMTFDDRNNDNAIQTDNVGTSDTTDGLGGVAQVDSLAVVNATVTYLDGSTATLDNIVMFQTVNGELFLSNSGFAGSDIRGPEQRELQSITVNSITSSSFTGLMHNEFESFACYVHGTRIATPRGPCRIEDLAVGDLVLTLDHGAQPIRWAGSSTVLQLGKMAPVRIAQGALGCGVPTVPLMVSQQHRMMIRSPAINRMTGHAEALIAAKALLAMEGIALCPQVTTVHYAHLLFDRHEIIFAEGAPSESLYPGPNAMSMMGPACRAEINAILPRLEEWRGGGVPARMFLEGRKRHQAVLRHVKNAKPVLVSMPVKRNGPTSRAPDLTRQSVV